MGVGHWRTLVRGRATGPGRPESSGRAIGSEAPDLVRRTGEPSSAWMVVLIALSLFAMIAQMPVPDPIRPWYLTIGAGGLLLATAAVVLREARDNLPALVLAFGTFAFWLLAFPPRPAADDPSAYLVFASAFFDDLESTLQPLSERRLFLVGGQYALQAPVINLLGVRALTLVEPCFGLLLFTIIVLSARGLPRYAAVLILGFLALAPLGHNRVLGNSQSAFVIGAFSLGLLAAGREIIIHRRGSWPLLTLVVLLPTAAAIFRPTTVPFNLPVALGIAAFAAVYVEGALRRLLVLAPTAVALFALSVQGYAQVFGTWLYPLLGRGTHITAEGYSIHGTVEAADHLGNLLAYPFGDPLFVAILGVQAMLLVFRPARAEALFIGSLFVVYLAFVALIVYTSISVMRFAFPAGLALFTMQLIVLARGFPMPARLVRLVGRVWPAAILSLLLLARLTGFPISAESWRMGHALSAAEETVLEEIAAVADTAGGATLLTYFRPGLFLVEKLEGEYFIMDRQGLVAPWTSRGLGYAEGFRRFVEERNVATIVMPELYCSASDGVEATGWRGLYLRGYERHEHAVCSMLPEFDRRQIGDYVVLVRSQAPGAGASAGADEG